MWIHLKRIDLDKLGSISGTIYSEDGNTLDDFIVEFFTEVNDPFMGEAIENMRWSDFSKISEMVSTEAKLLPGEYQVEAWGWGYDYTTNQNINYRPQIALDANGNPKTYLLWMKMINILK